MPTEIQELKERAEQIQAGDGPVAPGQPFHLTRAAAVNDCVHQGDVAMIVIDKVPDDLVQAKEKQAQLAKGSTRGSRHCIKDLNTVNLFLPPNWSDDDYLGTDGPVLVTLAQTEIEHAGGNGGHGTVTIDEGMTVACRYDLTRDLATKQERRVMD